MRTQLLLLIGLASGCSPRSEGLQVLPRLTATYETPQETWTAHRENGGFLTIRELSGADCESSWSLSDPIQLWQYLLFPVEPSVGAQAVVTGAVNDLGLALWPVDYEADPIWRSTSAVVEVAARTEGSLTLEVRDGEWCSWMSGRGSRNDPTWESCETWELVTILYEGVISSGPTDNPVIPEPTDPPENARCAPQPEQYTEDFSELD